MSEEKDLSEFVLELSQKKYEREIYRETSIIEHAGRLQTAFSFMTAGEFMAAPIIVSYRGELSLEFLLLVFSTITACLLFSLFAAVRAQKREAVRDFPPINDTKNYAEGNSEKLNSEKQRNIYYTNLLAGVDDDKTLVNDKRLKWIERSTISFYACLALCVFWFVVSLCKML